MRRRYRYGLNLFSLGLLLFALYLNFIKQEVAEMPDQNSSGKAVTNTTSSLKSDESLSPIKQPNETLVLK